MYLILFVFLMSLISVSTSLVITLIVNDKKLKNIVKTYGKDLEFISSAYISKIDSLKAEFEDSLSYREKLIVKKEEEKKHIGYNNQYLEESLLSFLKSLDEVNSLEGFYYLKCNLRKSFEVKIDDNNKI